MWNSPLIEIASVVVRLDHGASFIVKANHCLMRAAAMLCVVDCVAYCIRLASLRFLTYRTKVQ
jgi:hypothetical protein